MGVRFYGNVKIPTLRIGPKFPDIGRSIFEAETLSDVVTTIPQSVDQAIDNLVAYTDSSLTSNGIYEQETLSATSSVTVLPEAIDNVVAYTAESVQPNAFYDSETPTFGTNTIGSAPTTNIEVAVSEAILPNEFYDAETVQFTITDVHTLSTGNSIEAAIAEPIIANAFYDAQSVSF